MKKMMTMMISARQTNFYERINFVSNIWQHDKLSILWQTIQQWCLGLGNRILGALIGECNKISWVLWKESQKKHPFFWVPKFGGGDVGATQTDFDMCWRLQKLPKLACWGRWGEWVGESSPAEIDFDTFCKVKKFPKLHAAGGEEGFGQRPKERVFLSDFFP